MVASLPFFQFYINTEDYSEINDIPVAFLKCKNHFACISTFKNFQYPKSFLSPAGAIGPGTGDIATPPVRPSVCPSVCPSRLVFAL